MMSIEALVGFNIPTMCSKGKEEQTISDKSIKEYITHTTKLVIIINAQDRFTLGYGSKMWGLKCP